MARKPNSPPFKKGNDPRRNTTGKNKGHNKFETDFNAACKVIAKKTGKTFSEVRQNLLLVGYQHADKGEYNFWQYIHNQMYGTAKETVDMNMREFPPPILGNVRKNRRNKQDN